MPPSFNYIKADSISNAIRELKTDHSVLIAGGTDLAGCLRDGIIRADRVISISWLDDFKGIRITSDGTTHIGSLTPVQKVADHEHIRKQYRVLSMAASEVGSPQLRNQGTIGGNICQKPRCWYYRGDFNCRRKGGKICYAAAGENRFHAIFGGHGCFIVHPSDTASALMVLDASVLIMSDGEVKSIPLQDFFVLPEKDVTRENILEHGDVITEIVIPPSRNGTASSYRKVRSRGSWDFATAGTAIALTFRENRVDSVRIVLSGAAPIPWRLTEAEEAITGSELGEKDIEKACEIALQGAQALSQNKYKIELFKGIIEEELTDLKKRSSGKA